MGKGDCEGGSVGRVPKTHMLLDFGGTSELLSLAESVTAVELWIAREGYRNARL